MSQTTTEPKLKPGYTYPDRNPPLYMHYPGQHEPQGAYVQLHPDGEVEFGVNGEIGNAVPESVFHDRIVRICGVDPYLSLKGIDKLHREIRPILEDVAAGHSIEWNGNNNVGRLTEEAEEARERIMQLFWQADWDNYDRQQPEE
jgi:hypothetical protein